MINLKGRNFKTSHILLTKTRRLGRPFQTHLKGAKTDLQTGVIRDYD